MSYDYDRGDKSYHEAAHAVMAFAFNYLVTEVTLIPKPHVQARILFNLDAIVHPKFLKACWQTEVLVNVASFGGAKIHWEQYGNGNHDEPILGTGHDKKKASHALARIGQEDNECFKTYVNFAYTQLQHSNYLPVLNAVAQALYQRDTLTLDEINDFKSKTPKLVMIEIATELDDFLPERYRGIYPVVAEH